MSDFQYHLAAAEAELQHSGWRRCLEPIGPRSLHLKIPWLCHSGPMLTTECFALLDSTMVASGRIAPTFAIAGRQSTNLKDPSGNYNFNFNIDHQFEL